MEEKLFYTGIYGEDSIHLVREIINVARFEHTIDYYKGYIKPHIHNNLFQIFIIEEGTLQLSFNDDRYSIESKSFFTIPKNVLHGFFVNDNVKGWIISLSDMALERMLALDADIFFDIDEITIAKFDFENVLFENLYQTAHKCISEFNGNLPAKEFALEYLVGMLLIRLHRIPKENQTILKSLDNGYKIYYRRFKQLIKENYSFNIPIEFYSNNLSITSGHLNRICKSITGKSPKTIIIDYFITEAKNLLTQYSLSISEIAFKLGFEDPGYFTRLFRQKTNMTPKQYRKEIGLS